VVVVGWLVRSFVVVVGREGVEPPTSCASCIYLVDSGQLTPVGAKVLVTALSPTRWASMGSPVRQRLARILADRRRGGEALHHVIGRSQ